MAQVSPDLGTLEGPVLAFGGPYGNLAAVRALRAAAQRLGIPPERCICTGDVVAYFAHPQETTDALRAWGARVILDNCEESVAAGSPDCGCGFEPGSACSALAAEWYRFSAGRLTRDTVTWMATLPRQLRFTLGGRTWRVIHGGVDRINRFVFPSTAAAVKSAQIEAAGTDGVIAGHSGIPFGERVGRGWWLNAGAAGLPANDGVPGGWYLLLHPVRDALRVSWHRLVYDPAPEQDAMARHGLSTAYAEALGTGLWPSLDVLPEAERRQTGVPLDPPALEIPGGSARESRRA